MNRAGLTLDFTKNYLWLKQSGRIIECDFVQKIIGCHKNRFTKVPPDPLRSLPDSSKSQTARNKNVELRRLTKISCEKSTYSHCT